MLDFNTVDDEIKCPYCGYEFSDSWEYGDGETEIECVCGKSFHYYGELVLKQKVAKDCSLNNEKHIYVPYYKEMVQCKKCGDVKSNN